MNKCWDREPENRPLFDYLCKCTSSYIEGLAGYLEMNFAFAQKLATPTNQEDNAVKGTDDKVAVEEQKEEIHEELSNTSAILK